MPIFTFHNIQHHVRIKEQNTLLRALGLHKCNLEKHYARMESGEGFWWVRGPLVRQQSPLASFWIWFIVFGYSRQMTKKIFCLGCYNIHVRIAYRFALHSCPWGPITASLVDLLSEMYVMSRDALNWEFQAPRSIGYSVSMCDGCLEGRKVRKYIMICSASQKFRTFYVMTFLWPPCGRGAIFEHGGVWKY